MYPMLCQHFQISPGDGLEWGHTKDVLLQSNNSNSGGGGGGANNPPNNNRNANKGAAAMAKQTSNPASDVAAPSNATNNATNNNNSNNSNNSNNNNNTNNNNNNNNNTNNSNNISGIASPRADTTATVATVATVATTTTTTTAAATAITSNASVDENKVLSPTRETAQRNRQSQVQRPTSRFASPQPPNNAGQLDDTRSVGSPMNPNALTTDNGIGPDAGKHYRRTATKTDLTPETPHATDTAAGLTEKALSCFFCLFVCLFVRLMGNANFFERLFFFLRIC
ncbi:hypothetical protein RFI_19020 [Reticulomyxa filosa]|uniref:Uncharacterized protein n=1 Tax=Reticulomyxa filosa TaxID=46433 RepID=X6MWP0_RETFI|nr:hypothetical protein RFI_19020 [Reticulomyxa filosa]|eukprot:ETO18259.1 hypothetical protein RFI_19020 [Reticulomyxa filosa]